MHFAPSDQQKTQAIQPMMPWMVWIYTLLFSLVLTGVLFLVVKAEGAPSAGVPASLDPLFPTDWSDPVVLVTYALAAFSVTLALTIPKKLTKGPNLLAPYIVRLCSLEVCAVAGFILGFLRSDPYLAWPLAAAGIVMILLSAPTESFFKRLAS